MKNQKAKRKRSVKEKIQGSHEEEKEEANTSNEEDKKRYNNDNTFVSANFYQQKIIQSILILCQMLNQRTVAGNCVYII